MTRVRTWTRVRTRVRFFDDLDLTWTWALVTRTWLGLVGSWTRTWLGLVDFGRGLDLDLTWAWVLVTRTWLGLVGSWTWTWLGLATWWLASNENIKISHAVTIRVDRWHGRHYRTYFETFSPSHLTIAVYGRNLEEKRPKSRGMQKSWENGRNHGGRAERAWSR